MVVDYNPGWDAGDVRDYLDGLRDDGQRKKAAAKLDFDIHMLATTWPRPQCMSVKSMRGHEPLHELIREYQGIVYRIFFCVKLAYDRMRGVLNGNVGRNP